MKALNKMITVLSAGILFSLIGCASTSVQKSAFETETGLNVVVPMRYFTWVKADGSNQFSKDYSNGSFTFTYDSEADYMVKVETIDGVKNTTWGKQITETNPNINYSVFTAFIAACYSMEANHDSIDTVFSVLSQIFADSVYASNKQYLPETLKNGLEVYTNKTDYESFKADNFVIGDNTITIK